MLVKRNENGRKEDKKEGQWKRSPYGLGRLGRREKEERWREKKKKSG